MVKVQVQSFSVFTKEKGYLLCSPSLFLAFFAHVFTCKASFLCGTSQVPLHWTGRWAFSWSSWLLPSCHSFSVPLPSSGRSSSCDFPSVHPSGLLKPLCAWKRTGMFLFLGPPTRCCPSCHHFAEGRAGTDTSEFSSCYLEKQRKSAPTLLKIKIIYWHQGFHEELLTFIEPFHCTKSSLFFKAEKCSSDYYKVLLKTWLKGSLGNQKQLFYGLTTKILFYSYWQYGFNNSWVGFASLIHIQFQISLCIIIVVSITVNWKWSCLCPYHVLLLLLK